MSYKDGNGYIYLPVEIKVKPQEVIVGKNTLRLKDEFHISLLCTKDINDEKLQAKITKSFYEFVEKNPIQLVKISSNYRHAIKDERETVVVMVEVNNLDKFRESIKDKFDYELSVQTTHITLYCKQPNMGIGLNSVDELERLSKPLCGLSVEIIG